MPTAAAIDSTGNFLFVTFTFQNGFTTARPGPGGVAVFPIQHSNSDPSQEGLLGAPVVNTTVGTTAANPLPYFPIGFNPVGVFSNPKAGFVYVVDQDRSAAGAAAGMLLVFQYSAATGTLTPVAGPVASAASASVTGFSAGTTPAALAVDPTGRFIYVTDEATNQLYAYLETSSGHSDGAQLVAVYDRTVPDRSHGRSARRVCICSQLRLEHGELLHNRSG